MEFSLRSEVLKMKTMRVNKENQLKIRLLLLLVRLWVFWGRFSLVLVILTQDNSMDDRFDSLGAQVAAIDCKVSLGASVEEIHGDPTQSRSSKPAQSPLHA